MDHAASTLHLEIYDAGDVMNADRMLGQVDVPLDQLPYNQTLDLWFALRPSADDSSVSGGGVSDSADGAATDGSEAKGGEGLGGGFGT